MSQHLQQTALPNCIRARRLFHTTHQLSAKKVLPYTIITHIIVINFY